MPPEDAPKQSEAAAPEVAEETLPEASAAPVELPEDDATVSAPAVSDDDTFETLEPPHPEPLHDASSAAFEIDADADELAAMTPPPAAPPPAAAKPAAPHEIPDPFVHAEEDDEALPPLDETLDVDHEGEAEAGPTMTGAPTPPPWANASSSDATAAEESVDTGFTSPPAGRPETAHGDDAWDLEELVKLPERNTEAPQAGAPLRDEASASPFGDGPTVESPKVPPWKRGGGEARSHNSGSEPPELPGVGLASNTFRRKVGSGGSPVKTAVSLVLVGLLLFVSVMFLINRDKTIEMLARWTGTLNEVAQEVPPAEKAMKPAESGQLKAEEVVHAEAIKRTDEESADDVKAKATAPATAAKDDGNVTVKVLTVPPDEAKKPIEADGSEAIPEDVDRFAALQQAILKKRKEKQQESVAHLKNEMPDVDPTALPPEERTERNMKLINQVNKDLQTYRKALADVDNPALKPSPSKFFEQLRNKNGTAGDASTPSLAAPKTGAEAAAPAGQETYGNPIVQDPSAGVQAKQKKDDGVRTLNDFNISMFQPEAEHVRMPRGITPRMTPVEFPPLEILSLVPNYGLIGYAKGQQGVLLLGETLEGWELVAVHEQYAEFHMGERKKIVTLNGNR